MPKRGFGFAWHRAGRRDKGNTTDVASSQVDSLFVACEMGFVPFPLHLNAKIEESGATNIETS